VVDVTMAAAARGSERDRRRPELAAFLRSRRARITPADIGLPPGTRRRTPGLRREEVAQLAGVGVTWYTWLEQGRRINASAQVLDAVARTLRLDVAEREHLFHLAEVPFAPGHANGAAPAPSVSEDTRAVLDALDPLPSVIYNTRYDLLAHNRSYQTLFLGWRGIPEGPCNALWLLFTGRPEDCPLIARSEELKIMVATLRSAYGSHVGEPAWERFLAGLTRQSPEFAEMWASGDVAPPGPRVKAFRHPAVGEIRMRTQSLSINGMPDARMVVYVPGDEESRRSVELLRARQA
jgi:transcriptional regulator with XRE-family HTH domain